MWRGRLVAGLLCFEALNASSLASPLSTGGGVMPLAIDTHKSSNVSPRDVMSAVRDTPNSTPDIVPRKSIVPPLSIYGSPWRRRKFTMTFPLGIQTLEPGSGVEWIISYHAIGNPPFRNWYIYGDCVNHQDQIKKWNILSWRTEEIASDFMTGVIRGWFRWEPGEGMNVSAKYSWTEKFMEQSAHLVNTTDLLIAAEVNGVNLQVNMAYKYTYVEWK